MYQQFVISRIGNNSLLYHIIYCSFGIVWQVQNDYQKIYPENQNTLEANFENFYSKILPIFQKKVVSLQGKEWLKDSVDQSVKEGNSVIAYKKNNNF
jgi:hypothetical protein